MTGEELEQLRGEVARERGLDEALAKRLTGTTREELEADADELAGWQRKDSTPSVSASELARAVPRGFGHRSVRDPELQAIVDSVRR